MLVNPFNSNSPADDPIRDNSNNISTWDGLSPYAPFLTSADGVSNGGGGGGYVAPVPPNPTFVPPSYASNGIIKIHLIANTSVQFTENDINVGVGSSITLEKTTLSFGSDKIYNVVLNGKRSKNYFSVAIEKTHNTSTTILATQNTVNSFTNTARFTGASAILPPLTFSNSATSNVSVNDYLYSETINVKEFEFDSNTNTYKFLNERKLNKTVGTVDLRFELLEKEIVPVLQNTGDVPYRIQFLSNFQNELGEVLSLKYDIIDINKNTIKSGVIKLSNGGTDVEKLPYIILKDSVVNFKLIGNLLSNYAYKSISYTTLSLKTGILNDPNLINVGEEFSVPGKSLLNTTTGISIIANVERRPPVIKPELTISKQQYDKEIKESDVDGTINVQFSTINTDYVNVYVDANKVIKVPAKSGYFQLSFKKDFSGVYGKKNIILVPDSDKYGTGNRAQIIINFISVNDFPSITEIDVPTDIVVPSFSDLNITYDVIYNTFATTTVDVELLLKNKTHIKLYTNLQPNGVLKINLKELAAKHRGWNGSDNVTLTFKPYNRGGVKELVGNEYEVSTKIQYPSFYLDEDIIRKALYNAFHNHLKFDEPEKDNKYLTHLATFENDDHILVSTWEDDTYTLSDKRLDETGKSIITNEVKSVILKLYNPLPPDVTENSTFWITKLMTNPLIETVILNELDTLECPPIKGPNFQVDIDFVNGNGTGYESLDDLIISASSSTNLIQSYLNASNLNTDDLNIEYCSGSLTSGSAEILWRNFVHFSSAQERVDNFVYKVQLIEKYENLILSASVGAQTGSLAGQQEVERQKTKKASLIQGFDGFEMFLYTSSSYTNATSHSITWPYGTGGRLNATNQQTVGWYQLLSEKSNYYDSQNSNYLINNIPNFITIKEENDNFLLFFSMVGQHFDNIYYYTKAIERGRGMGYKAKDGMPDKLLYDTLQSLSWDAKNLGSSDELWKYVFGEDSAGNATQTNPTKARTNEVWRRIVNNLPYLLKHKGSRRGVYALMACYGIPSSNLSIIEFGGPEVTDETKNKLLMDDLSHALKINSGETITVPVTNAKAIELFVKPATAGNYTLATSNGVTLIVSGAIGSQYGTVKYGTIETSQIPIFNGRPFGICVSNESSYRRLDVMQTIVDREIFSVSKTGSSALSTNSPVFGGTFVGNIDEIRVWNQPLSSSIFAQHAYYPEMVNGNNITSSTGDLEFRLDFEYPKQVGTGTKFINVAPAVYYSSSYDRNYYEDGGSTVTIKSNPTKTAVTASTSGFTLVTTYPYNFEVIDRDVVLELPDIGASRYATNKVRIEEQTLISDLSSKTRSTIKAFDDKPIDSNRVGLFFSPNKELNLDIAKSFGGTNLDNYIGDPSDRYNDTYKDLNNLRDYYFKRIHGRDIYSYMNLIRLYEKAMFDDIKKMLPARSKPTTGLLIEPHFLERSKKKYTKPTAEDEQLETVIEHDRYITAENEQFETIIEHQPNIESENEQYESLIVHEPEVYSENFQVDSTLNAKIINVSSESENYESIVDAKIENSGKGGTVDENVVSLYEEVGFGLYAKNGYAIRNYYNEDGVLIKDRVVVHIVKTERPILFEKYAVIASNTGLGDKRFGFIPGSGSYIETNLVVQTQGGTGRYRIINNSGKFIPGILYEFKKIPRPNDDYDFSNIGGPGPGQAYVGLQFYAKGSIPDAWPVDRTYSIEGQPNETPPNVIGNIISVTAVSGYLPTHYRNVNDLTTGMQNSYYKGSKNTEETTLDGTPPIETFSSNPNTLKITGRDNNEPIISTE